MYRMYLRVLSAPTAVAPISKLDDLAPPRASRKTNGRHLTPRRICQSQRQNFMWCSANPAERFVVVPGPKRVITHLAGSVSIRGAMSGESLSSEPETSPRMMRRMASSSAGPFN
jgi:hypothetical protein